MPLLETYVCAFRGRRDSYQAPLALAEAGLLDQFITDAYAVWWLKMLAMSTPRSIRAKIDFRYEPGIPKSQLKCLWGLTMLEHARHKLGCAPMLTYAKLDRNFSRAAARRAARTGSHLFLYSPYAWEAFNTRYPHVPHKVLFQYHPHPELERRILADDRAEYPAIGESFSGIGAVGLPDQLFRRERDCWKYADLILCASSFTKRSLVEAGCDEGRCRVIPYGVELSYSTEEEEPSGDAFQAVFVGSGGQRKGLHHLLLAWQKASLPASSKLVLVCRVIDRGIERLVAATPRVELRPGVTPIELDQLYRRSSLFVMPSLVEGFGQVYLEALAQGCPVLGTPNTCLPDVGTESDGVFIVTPANEDELIAKLECLAHTLPGDLSLRRAAQACARQFTWKRFRNGLRTELGATNGTRLATGQLLTNESG